jgi:hypothetical protein
MRDHEHEMRQRALLRSHAKARELARQLKRVRVVLVLLMPMAIA